MLVIMQAFAFALRFVLSALVCLTISVSPVFALSGVQGTVSDVSFQDEEGPPCNMPCDDCGDTNDAQDCALACSGLITAMVGPIPASPFIPAAVRVGTATRVAFVGHDDEPAKPPPKPILA